MKSRGKTLQSVLIGLAIVVLVLGGLSIVPIKRFNEFARMEDVKGYWASLQDFTRQNGRYPKDDAEIAAFFHMTPEQVAHGPVDYIPPHDTNTDEVILWWKQKTLFGVKIGITESGDIIKK